MLTKDKIQSMWNMVYNISLNMLHNPQEAEDITQEIFLKILEKIDTFKNQAKIETWIYRVAYNH